MRLVKALSRRPCTLIAGGSTIVLTPTEYLSGNASVVTANLPGLYVQLLGVPSDLLEALHSLRGMLLTVSCIHRDLGTQAEGCSLLRQDGTGRSAALPATGLVSSRSCPKAG